MERLRVCQLITELAPAGAERCVYQLATGLDCERFEPRVIALRGGEVGQWLTERGVPVDVLGLRGKWDATRLFRLVGLLNAARPDILHTHLFHADLAGRLAGRLIGLRRLVHTIHVAEARFRPWRFTLPRAAPLERERLICVSEAVRRHHLRRTGLSPERYRVIRNGIDVGAFARDEERRRALRRRWSLSDDQPLLAFVGRLDRQKGVDTLLGAMAHLGARGAPAELVIAGDGPQRGMVENFVARAHGGAHTRLLGWRDDVAALLSAADVFVLPSRWEGFGLAAVEAMAAGLPVIATRVPGLSEVVAHGRTGLLLPPGDATALAEAIVELIEDPTLCARLGRAGRKRAGELFSLERFLSEHAELYDDLARPLSR